LGVIPVGVCCWYGVIPALLLQIFTTFRISAAFLQGVHPVGGFLARWLVGFWHPAWMHGGCCCHIALLLEHHTSVMYLDVAPTIFICNMHTLSTSASGSAEYTTTASAKKKDVKQIDLAFVILSTELQSYIGDVQV
jgi:hypothetical protein